MDTAPLQLEVVQKEEDGAKQRRRTQSKRSESKKQIAEEKKQEEELSEFAKKERKIIQMLNDKQATVADPDKHFVVFEFFLNKLGKLSTGDENVELDYILQFWWKDKELVGKTLTDVDVGAIWKPDVEFGDIEEIEAMGEVADTYAINDQMVAHGVITHFRRYKARVSVPMQLQSFPFDSQVIKLAMSSACYSADDCEFVDITSKESIDHMSKGIELNEWQILGSVKVYEKKELNFSEQRDYSFVYMEVSVKRKPGFYMQKVFSLVFIIGLMVCGVPVVPAEQLNDRFQITLTLFLSQIAFNFVVAESLPKVSYTTKLDQYFLVNYIFLCLSALENVVTFLVAKYNSEDIALYIDYAFIAFFFVVHMVNSVLYARHLR